MKRFKYIGGHDAVDVPGLGTVEQGHLVQVHDTEMAASMQEQTDTWEHIPDPKKSAAAKAAASNQKD